MDDREVHSLYKLLVNSGHAFGAKRWVATLDRQCERLASAMATNIPTGEGGGRCKRILAKVLSDVHFVGMKCFSRMGNILQNIL